MKTLKKWLKSLKFEITWTVAAALVFFLVLPWVILALYGTGATSTGIVAADYLADLGYRLFRVAVVFLLGWGILKWWFPTMENHVDVDEPGTRFKDDWKDMTPVARNALTIITILGILLSLTLLIVFP